METTDDGKKNQQDDVRQAADSGPASQSFDRIGLFEAVNGNVVLRGRHGERDHIYPLHRAVERVVRIGEMTRAMARNGIRGWDTLLDIGKDLEARIREACRQRESLGEPVPPEVLDFLAKSDAGL